MNLLESKILILSMPKSKNRRAFMEMKMNSIGIKNYKYIDAVDVKKIKNEFTEYEEKCKIKKIKPISIESFACLFSYLLFFRNVEPDNYIIFEDDIYFNFNFFDIILKIQSLKKNYDILYLGHNNFNLSKQQINYIKNKKILVPVDKKIITYGTYGIFYSLKAIQFIKQTIFDFPIKPIDHIIWEYVASKLESFIVFPPLVIPEVRTSTIRKENQNIYIWCKKRNFDVCNYMHIDKYSHYSSPFLLN
jgi:GR25 family glycosyltransferase involved in LPS biosynthesis